MNNHPTHQPAATIWLTRRPPLYLPRRLHVLLASSLDPATSGEGGPPEHEPAAFATRLLRQRHVGRLLPQGLRLADYQPYLVGPQPAPPQPGARPAPPPDHTAEPLTPRERQILRAVADGHASAEIAAQLHLTEGTVKWHLNKIYSKLGVRRRTQAVARARSLGYLKES